LLKSKFEDSVEEAKLKNDSVGIPCFKYPKTIVNPASIIIADSGSIKFYEEE